MRKTTFLIMLALSDTDKNVFPSPRWCYWISSV